MRDHRQPGVTHLRLVVVGRYELFVLKRAGDFAALAADEAATDDAPRGSGDGGGGGLAVTHRAHLARVGFVGHPDDACDPHVFIVLCDAAGDAAQLARGTSAARGGGFDEDEEEGTAALGGGGERAGAAAETHDGPFELAFREEELDRALEVRAALSRATLNRCTGSFVRDRVIRNI